MNPVLLVTTAQAFLQQMLIDLLVLGEGKTRDNSSEQASAHTDFTLWRRQGIGLYCQTLLELQRSCARLHVREHSTASLPEMCVAAREQTLLSHFPL